MPINTCKYCGREWMARERKAVYCSKECHRTAQSEAQRGVPRADWNFGSKTPPQPQAPPSVSEIPTRNGLKATRILVIPDLHAPFHDDAMLEQALQTPADLVVVMGDVLDMYAVSRFTQYEKVSADEEWSAAQSIMRKIADRYPEVHVISGNHDKRLERQVRAHVPMEWVNFILKQNDGSLNPLRAICREFPNVTVVENSIDDRLSADWFVKIGDCIFSHAEKYSRVPGSALRGVEEWFSDFEHVVGATGYKVIVQAHTHSMSLFPWRADKWLVECGCLCKQHGYQFQARIGGRPQRRGYVTLTQHNGVTDVNSIRLVSLEGAACAGATDGRGA